jgi:hypothetical protein
MTPALTCLSFAIGVACLAAAGAGWVLRHSRQQGFRRRLRRTVVIHTRDGRSLRGLLVGEYSDCIVLAHAELLDEEMKIGGEAIVALSNVSWAQDVTGVGDSKIEIPPSFEIDRGARL